MIKIYQKSSSNQSAERVTSWSKKRNIPYVVISKTSLCKEDIVRVLELSNKGFEEINPIMIYLLEKPLFCFVVKCILPLILVGYIFYAIKNASDNLIYAVNIVMLIVVVFYSLINIMHIINFIVLFNMY